MTGRRRGAAGLEHHAGGSGLPSDPRMETTEHRLERACSGRPNGNIGSKVSKPSDFDGWPGAYDLFSPRRPSPSNALVEVRRA
jgi:hypothetical protein